MRTQQATNRLTFFGSLAMLLAAGIVGCGSPVATPDGEPTSPLLKGGKSSTTTSPWEKEPNDNPALASDVIGTAAKGGGRQGFISSATDNDYFLTYAVPAGKTFTVHLGASYPRDYDVQLLASDGVTVLAHNHQQAGMGETITYTNQTSTSQTYKLRVFSYDGSYSATSLYTLIVGKVN